MAQKTYVSLSKLSTFLDNLKKTFASSSHKHTVSDITDYVVDSSLSSTSTNPIQNKVLNEEFDSIATAMNALETAIDSKADSSHNHSITDIKEITTTNTIFEECTTTGDDVLYFSSIDFSKLSGQNVTVTIGGVVYETNCYFDTSNLAYTINAGDYIIQNMMIDDMTYISPKPPSGTTITLKSVEVETYIPGAYISDEIARKNYVETVIANHNHDSAYDTKGSAAEALTSAKSYADTVGATVKNDLLNGAGDAYDTLKELGDLIDDNTDAIEALETVAAGKANSSHSHAIADITDLQYKLDTKANQTKFDAHESNTTMHITSTERAIWNAAKTHADSAHAPSNAEKNQNAFSNIAVGSTTVAADSATDTVTFVGSNVTITPDASNDKITFSVADGTTSTKGIVQLTDSVSSDSTTTAATPNSVKTAYDLANTANTTLDEKLDKIDPMGSGLFTLDGKLTVGMNSVADANGGSSAVGQDNTIAGSGLAIGTDNIITGNDCLVAGYSNYCASEESFAFGNGLCVNSDNQIVIGKSNVEDATEQFISIVGNGINSITRSNAHTLDWDGNAWFAGDVYVGSTSGINKDDGSVKLVSTADLDSYSFITTADVDEICGNTLIVNAAELTY